MAIRLAVIGVVLLLLAGPSASRADTREEVRRQRVEGLFAGLIETLEREEGRFQTDARERGERLGQIERSLRLLGLAAGHLMRGSPELADRPLAEAERLLASIRPDRSRFAGELLATEAGQAHRALGIAREALEADNPSRGLAAVRLAGRYAKRARDVAAASVLPLFE